MPWTVRLKASASLSARAAPAFAKNKAYICAEILADDVILDDNDAGENKISIDDVEIAITIKKIQK